MGKCFQTGTVSPAIFCCSRQSFQFHSALQLRSSHLWRTTRNSLLCCNTTLLIRFSNLCLHFNYSTQKRNFWKAKWVKEREKWVNRKSKIVRFIEHKKKQNRKEKKQILSRPTFQSKNEYIREVRNYMKRIFFIKMSVKRVKSCQKLF